MNTIPTAAAETSTLAGELSRDLHRLAQFVAFMGDELAGSFRWNLDRILVPAGTREQVVAYARLGARHGAKVTKHHTGDWAGVDVSFGQVSLHVYAGRGEVCEKVVLGSREVTKMVPDPEQVAAVPLVEVVETVEDVEWRCLPLLADARGEQS